MKVSLLSPLVSRAYGASSSAPQLWVPARSPGHATLATTAWALVLMVGMRIPSPGTPPGDAAEVFQVPLPFLEYAPEG